MNHIEKEGLGSIPIVEGTLSRLVDVIGVRGLSAFKQTAMNCL